MFMNLNMQLENAKGTTKDRFLLTIMQKKSRIFGRKLNMSIIKDNNNRLNYSGNYRHTCLSNVFTNNIDTVIVTRAETLLQTSSVHFGLQSKYWTELCVYVFK